MPDSGGQTSITGLTFIECHMQHKKIVQTPQPLGHSSTKIDGSFYEQQKTQTQGKLKCGVRRRTAQGL